MHIWKFFNLFVYRQLLVFKTGIKIRKFLPVDLFYVNKMAQSRSVMLWTQEIGI